MQSDLIYDVGMHLGEDTEFYLKKGFRVIAIEADPAHCASVRKRFEREIIEKRLVIVNKAIVEKPGPVKFYRNLNISVWGTVKENWMDRNNRLGTRSEVIEVEGITMESILNEFGVPYYLKVDIEGSDLLCLNALKSVQSRPKFLSFESSKLSLNDVRRELSLMTELGYGGFKVVPQHKIMEQRLPTKTREGISVNHEFPFGSSGLFGEETPGIWVTAKAVMKLYLPIFLRYWLIGDDPLIKSNRVRNFLQRHGVAAGWYDTHARLGPAATT